MDIFHEAPEYEFGTSTGRQGRFNPRDRTQRRMAIDRLMELEGSYGEKLDPRFTGYTGLGAGDAVGYSQMLNARTEAENIQRLLGGQQALNTRDGGVMRGPSAVQRHRASTLQEQDRQRSPALYSLLWGH